MLLGTGKAGSKASCIILLLIDETSKTSVFTLVVLDLDFEVLSLLGELLSKSLEFEELQMLARITLTLDETELTCCFQLSSSSTRKLFLLVTLPSSVSIRPLRLIKSCQASRASLEYWLRSRTISFKCLMDTLVMRGFLTAPPKTAFMPVLRPCRETSISKRGTYNPPWGI